MYADSSSLWEYIPSLNLFIKRNMQNANFEKSHCFIWIKKVWAYRDLGKMSQGNEQLSSRRMLKYTLGISGQKLNKPWDYPTAKAPKDHLLTTSHLE